MDSINPDKRHRRYDSKDYVLIDHSPYAKFTFLYGSAGTSFVFHSLVYD
jgi:hypothetical protein